MEFVVHELDVTASTNADARAGRPGDVFVARRQTAGRGRLGHAWASEPGLDLAMSAVFSAEGLPPEAAATFPLAVGLAVAEALARLLPPSADVKVKWPNDVWAAGRKIAGILCERHGDALIAGIGVNVGRTAFPAEFAARSTSCALLEGGDGVSAAVVRRAVLEDLGAVHDAWRARGFAALWPRLAARDALRGRLVEVRRTDADAHPARGRCGGVLPTGALDVAGESVWAGEAHVLAY